MCVCHDVVSVSAIHDIDLFLHNNGYAGCPAVVRLDRGTENVKIAAVQYTFRENHGAGDKSFRFGTSPANIVSIAC